MQRIGAHYFAIGTYADVWKGELTTDTEKHEVVCAHSLLWEGSHTRGYASVGCVENLTRRPIGSDWIP